MKILDIIRTALLSALALLMLIGVIGIFSINGHLKEIESSTTRTAHATYLISEAPIMELTPVKRIHGHWSLPVAAWSWDGR